VTKLVIYYCGHGSPGTGAWVCYKEEGSTEKNELLHTSEILNLIVEKNFTKSIEITSESCYSGLVCKNAKKWIEDK